MKRILMIAIMAGCFVGCTLPGIKLPFISPPEQPKTIYNYKETIKDEPVILDIQQTEFMKDKVVISRRTEKTVEANMDTTPQKIGILQRIGSTIANLTVWGAVILVILAVFFPSTIFLFIVNRLRATAKALKQTVAAIKETNVVETTELGNKLRAKQDPETKRMIGVIKSEL